MRKIEARKAYADGDRPFDVSKVRYGVWSIPVRIVSERDWGLLMDLRKALYEVITDPKQPLTLPRDAWDAWDRLEERHADQD
jgi:hypothetical protein